MRMVRFLLDLMMALWLVPLSRKERVRYSSARGRHCWPPAGRACGRAGTRELSLVVREGVCSYFFLLQNCSAFPASCCFVLKDLLQPSYSSN